MCISNRVFFAIISASCLSLLAYGYYLEFFEDLLPCPMCIFQRLCYMAITLASLIAVIQAPQRTGGITYGVLVIIFSTIGASIAGRQTWLQHIPAELVPECGPGLEFMLEMYPLLEAIERALLGTGDCAAVSWTFISMSIAEWSLACFIGLLVVALYQTISNWRTVPV